MAKSVIGGQAVIEGVMMRNKNQLAVAVRKADGRIVVIKESLTSLFFNHSVFKLSFIRGVTNLIDTLVIGIKTLNWSADQALDDEEASEKKNAINFKGEKRKKEEKNLAKEEKEQNSFSSWYLVGTLAFALLFSVLLFVILPLYLTRFLTESQGLIFNIIDGLIRIAIFLIYIAVISLFSDVRRVFQYHGAEHKSVYCYEAGKALTPKNVQTYSCLHPRCGTTFILLVLVISIILFSLITHPSWVVKFGVRIIFIPLIAALSYELLQFGGRHFSNPIVKIFVAPGLLLQRMTTRKPTKAQIEVAIAALKAVM